MKTFNVGDKFEFARDLKQDKTYGGVGMTSDMMNIERSEIIAVSGNNKYRIKENRTVHISMCEGYTATTPNGWVSRESILDIQIGDIVVLKDYGSNYPFRWSGDMMCYNGQVVEISYVSSTYFEVHIPEFDYYNHRGCIGWCFKPDDIDVEATLLHKYASLDMLEENSIVVVNTARKQTCLEEYNGHGLIVSNMSDTTFMCKFIPPFIFNNSHIDWKQTILANCGFPYMEYPIW